MQLVPNIVTEKSIFINNDSGRMSIFSLTFSLWHFLSQEWNFSSFYVAIKRSIFETIIETSQHRQYQTFLLKKIYILLVENISIFQMHFLSTDKLFCNFLPFRIFPLDILNKTWWIFQFFTCRDFAEEKKHVHLLLLSSTRIASNKSSSMLKKTQKYTPFVTQQTRKLYYRKSLRGGNC